MDGKVRRDRTAAEALEREREGQPERVDRGIERERPERKVGDKIAGEPGRERAPDEPAEGPREPQEPRTTHVE